MEEKFPGPGVAAYALMAAGGDFGASVAPQLLGVIVDKVAASEFTASLCSDISLTPEQVGMKAAMLAAALFPVVGVIILLIIKKVFGIKLKKN